MTDTSIEATEFIRRFLKPGERPSSKHFLAALAAERAAGYADAVAQLGGNEIPDLIYDNGGAYQLSADNIRDALVAYLETHAPKETQ